MNKKPSEERKEIFEETRRIYGRDRRLADSISFSQDNQRVITEDMEVAPPGYPGMKVCVLNFASASNPGGGVAKGSMRRKNPFAGAVPCMPAFQMRRR